MKVDVEGLMGVLSAQQWHVLAPRDLNRPHSYPEAYFSPRSM